jgi:hypothetical protein
VVVADRGKVARPLQQLLPPPHLSKEGGVHAVHQGQIVGQVGDHARHLGQPIEPGESGASLEVDEDEGKQVGRVAESQAGNHGPQQFALPGAGGSDHQTVRAVSAQRRLLEIQDHRLSLRADPDRQLQAFAQRPRPPDLGRLEGPDVGNTQQVGELDGLHQAVLSADLGREPERRQPPGQSLRGVAAQAIGLALGHRFLLSCPLQQEDAARLQAQAQVDGRGLRLLALRQGEDGDPAPASEPQQFQGVRRRHDPIRHDDEPGTGRSRLVGRRSGTGDRSFGGHSTGQFALPAQRDGGSPATAAARAPEVGQPLRPLPVAPRRLAQAEHEADVVGCVQGGELTEQRPRGIQRRAPRTDQAEDSRLGQPHGQGLVSHRPLHREEVANRVLADRIWLVQRVGASLESEPRCQRPRPPADSELQEVGVVWPPFPAPCL